MGNVMVWTKFIPHQEDGQRRVCCPYCRREILLISYLRTLRKGSHSNVKRGLICPSCQKVKEYDEPEDKTFSEKLKNGFHLLKGDCDAKNDIDFVAVTHELTDCKPRPRSTGKKRYNTPLS